MKLSDYLSSQNVRLSDFARQIDEPVSKVHDWKTGRRNPRLDVAAKIERATGGMVTASDFFPRDEPATAA
ncbi:MAG TPA: helix-turn-helix transcriptional regulator [Acidiphilium sp.]|nr:helix-turn-helix transcriptional regulator [Acidiphilium sp.]